MSRKLKMCSQVRAVASNEISTMESKTDSRTANNYYVELDIVELLCTPNWLTRKILNILRSLFFSMRMRTVLMLQLCCLFQSFLFFSFELALQNTYIQSHLKLHIYREFKTCALLTLASNTIHYRIMHEKRCRPKSL